jgi:hypothetical protein
MKYAIETRTFCDGWVNTWTDNDESPVMFDTHEQAQQELNEFLSDAVEAFVSGNINDPYLRKDYRIIEVTE